MSVTISELLQQPAFSAFRVVAGVNGLNHNVSKVNILDFEYDALQDSESEGFGLFEKEALVLSSLLFAKEHPEMILESVKLLVRDGASALAIKEIYYHELPLEVIDYANQHQFVILMFKREGGFFETLITELTSLIEMRSNDELNEQKLTMLMDETLTMGSQRMLSEELFPTLKTPFYAAYSKPNLLLSKQELKHTIQSLTSTSDTICMFYQSGILALGGVSLPETFKEAAYPTGFSLLHKNLDEVSMAVKEAMCACEYAVKNNQNSISFNDIGIYRLLYPLKNNLWMKSYCELLKADISKDSNSEELMQTAEVYVHYQGDILKTSEALHLHKNTVRYRINRLKELLAKDHEAEYFEEQLTLMVLMNQILRG